MIFVAAFALWAPLFWLVAAQPGVDSTLRWFGRHGLDPVAIGLLVFGPPTIAVLSLGVIGRWTARRR